MDTITSYLPSAATITGGIRDFTSLIGTAASSTSLQHINRAPRSIIWKSFEVIHHNNHQYSFLILALVDGFIVFQVSNNGAMNAASPSSSSVSSPVDVRKVAMHTDGVHAPIHMAKLMYYQPADSSSYDDNGVLIAVTSADDRASFPRSLVKIFSVARMRYVHVLRFRSRVHAIATSRATLVVMLQKELHVYRSDGSHHPLHFDLVFSTKCFTNHDDYGVMALNHRWLAYGGVEALMAPSSPSLPAMNNSTNNSSSSSSTSTAASGSGTSSGGSAASLLSSLTQSGGTASSNITNNGTIMTRSLVDYLPSASDAKETVGAVSKGIVSGLMMVGDFGRKKLAGYVADATKDEPIAVATPLVSTRDAPHAGTVIIRDIQYGHVISHFRAHDDAIGCMHFDPSMTLLVTVSSDGTYIHVYQVVASSSASSSLSSYDTSPSIAAMTPSVTPSPLELPPASSSSSSSSYDTAATGSGMRRGSIDNNNEHSSSSSSSPWLITRQLYRIYRGITTATIRSVSFSMNSKWMAVSSPSTTHVYAINRFGGVPTLATHGHCAAYHDVAAGSQLFAESSIIKLSSSRRIRVPRASLANEAIPVVGIWPPIVTSFHRMISSDNDGTEYLLVLDRDELLTLHQLTPRQPLLSSTKSSSHDHGELKVDLDVKALSSWDLYNTHASDRSSSSRDDADDTKRLTSAAGPWLESSPSSSSSAATTTVTHDSAAAAAHPLFGLLSSTVTDTDHNEPINWLSHLELRVASPNDIPLWASPQFTQLTYNIPIASNGGDILSSMRSLSSSRVAAVNDALYDPNYLYYEDLPSERLKNDKTSSSRPIHTTHIQASTLDDSLELDLSDAIGSTM